MKAPIVNDQKKAIYLKGYLQKKANTTRISELTGAFFVHHAFGDASKPGLSTVMRNTSLLFI